MAFDGVTVSCITRELKDKLIDSRIYKIAQPEKDELLFTFRTNEGNIKVSMSVSASLPLIYETEENKPSPITAPGFLMLLRKHLNNGRVKEIYQPSLERIIMFKIEHFDELYDLCEKTLIIELMGKHSNIIFVDDKNTVIDSIKHVNALMSSVREILPGKPYFIPNMDDKKDPFNVTKEDFFEIIKSKNSPVSKALYSSFTGLSPLISEELLIRSEIDSSVFPSDISDERLLHLYNNFTWLLDDIKDGNFAPVIYSKDGNVKDYAALKLKLYDNLCEEEYPSISTVLRSFYLKKQKDDRIRQKSTDLRKIVSTILERNIKKYDLQLKQLKDSEKKDKYKVYGELITAYGYGLDKDAKSFEAVNFYNGETVTVPLDNTITPLENAKKYFDKYSKLKRTGEALSTLCEATHMEIEHLDSIKTSLDLAENEEDLNAIREELIESGYVKRKGGSKKAKLKNKPLHYISSEGFHMYVGKNNFQNEEVSFKIANSGDWWFHAKKIPGSHVIIKSDGREITNKAFEEAASLAGYYSKGANQDKIEVDYVKRKELKKPNGSPIGFVVYYTNYSMVVKPDISSLTLAD